MSQHSTTILAGFVLLINGVQMATVPYPRILREKLSQEKAVNACQELGPEYHLPPLSDSQSAVRLRETLRANRINETWLSVRRQTFPTWTWFNGKTVGNDFESQNWQPNMDCGVVHLRDGAFEADTCTHKEYGYICEVTDGSGCSTKTSPRKCLEAKNENKTFIYDCFSENWYHAKHWCAQNGMRLAYISDEKTTVQEMKAAWYKDDPQCTQLWVGFRRQDWDYNFSAIFPRWSNGEPTKVGDCATVQVMDSGKLEWQVVDCNLPQSAVCMYEKASDIVMTTAAPDNPKGSSAGEINPQADHLRFQETKVVITAVLIPLLLIIIGVGVALLALRHRKKRRPNNRRKDEPEMANEEQLQPMTKEMPNEETANPNTVENQIPVTSAAPSQSTSNVTDENISQIYKWDNAAGISLAPTEYGHAGSAPPEVTWTYTEVGGRLRLDGSDVWLDIPAGAIPEGTGYDITLKVIANINEKKCKIPQDKLMVTPIVDLSCHGRFQTPVLLYMRHNLRRESALRSFQILYRSDNFSDWSVVDTTKSDETAHASVEPYSAYVRTRHLSQYVGVCQKDEFKYIDLSAVAFADYNRVSKKSTQVGEITFRIFVLDSVHSTKDFINALINQQPGQVIRQDMQIDVPASERILQTDELDIEFTVYDGLKVVGPQHAVKTMYHAVPFHHGKPWRMVGEFVAREKSPDVMVEAFHFQLDFTIRPSTPGDQSPAPVKGRTARFTQTVTTYRGAVNLIEGAI